MDGTFFFDIRTHMTRISGQDTCTTNTQNKDFRPRYLPSCTTEHRVSWHTLHYGSSV